MEVSILEKAKSIFDTIKEFEIIKNIYSLIQFLLNNKEIITIIITILIVMMRILGFRRKTYKITNSTIDRLKREKKYIPNIFVELNDCKETLRYFIYGTKWKKRIANKFNNLYDNVYGKMLEKSVKDSDKRFRVSKFLPLSNLQSIIKEKIQLHNLIKERNYSFVDGRPEYDYYLESSSDVCLGSLRRLEKFSESSLAKYLILTGSAGNGKTNLLCSISELIMSLKNPVVFVTGREIEGTPKQYIFNKFDLHHKIYEHLDIYLKIENFLLLASCRYFYIVIDAVNENENGNFSEDLINFINEMLSYSRFKVIVSCRNEYYKTRYKKSLFNKAICSPFELDVKDQEYSETALNKIFDVYKNAYNYKGEISESVKDVLCNQLLLLRMFFETNSNSNKDVFTICKQDVFKNYIKKISEYTSTNIEAILLKIAQIMIQNNQYDKVSISFLENRGLSIEKIKKTIDESVILSKTIITNKGNLAEMEYEAIYFVFDELRDYILSREIVVSNANMDGMIDSTAVIQKIEEIEKTGSSVLEGIIQYTYLFFREFNDNEKPCIELLKLIKTTSEDENFAFFKRRNSFEFQNIGLRIVLTSGLEFNNFEKSYIRDCLIKDPQFDGILLFDVMLKGTINNGIYDLHTYLDLLFGIGDINVKNDILSAIMNYNNHSKYHIPDDLKNIHKLVLKTNPDLAIQVQCLAEIILLCFKFNNLEKRFMLENYFYNLDNHYSICKEVKDKYAKK